MDAFQASYITGNRQYWIPALAPRIKSGVASAEREEAASRHCRAMRSVESRSSHRLRMR